MIRYRRLGYLALNVSDLERSARFYAEQCSQVFRET